MRLHSDQVAAVVLIMLATLAFAATYWFDPVPAAIQQGMGPERFPRLAAGTIIALSVGLFFLSRGKTRSKLAAIDPVVWIVMAGGIAFMAAVALVGLVVAMGLALIALGLLWGEQRYGALLANAVLLPAVIWISFVKGLQVPLPTGLLGKLFGW